MDKSLDLIKGNGKEIAWLFFIGETNQIKIFEKLHPKEYKDNIGAYNLEKRKYANETTKKRIRVQRKRLNTNLISSCFRAWKSNFLELREYSQERPGKGKSIYIYPKKLYKFNLEPVFLFFKNNNIILSQDEKNILSYVFEAKPVREKLYNEFKDIDFIDAVIRFYFKYFYLPYLKYQGGIYKNIKPLSREHSELFQLDNPLITIHEGEHYLTSNKEPKIIIEYFIGLRNYKKTREIFNSLDYKMQKILNFNIN